MDFLQKLNTIQQIATLPVVAFRVLELIEDADVTAEDIARVVESDPSITLKILRVANSPLYGIRTEIASVRQAIVTLGLNRISNIVVGVALFSKFFQASQQQNSLMHNFWRHSTATGTVAKSLAQKLQLNYNEREFVGGLIHDIGKMVMIQYFPDQYTTVVNMIENDSIQDVQAERQVFGADHTDAGRVIANMWKLPRDLRSIIMNHASPDDAEDAKDMLAVVRIADLLCEMWGASAIEGIRELDLEHERSWEILCDIRPMLKELDVEMFTFELEEEFKKAEMFINLILSDI